MKKKPLTLLLLVLAVLLAGGAALWYARPMPLRQLCPELDLSQCSSITVYYEVVGRTEGNQRLVLEPDDPAFDTLLREFQSRTFSRSLTSLLPSPKARTIPTEDGDFQWELMLEFDTPVVTPDGNGHQGMLVRLSNFFGSLSLDHMLADRTWNVTTQDQEAWVSQVMDTIAPAVA